GALVHGIIRHILSGKENPAAVWPNEPNDHVETRCLSGAVRAEQPHDLATPHLDVDSINDSASAVHFHELLRYQNVFLLDGLGEGGSRRRGGHWLLDHHGLGAGVAALGSCRISVRLGPWVSNCPVSFKTMTVS